MPDLFSSPSDNAAAAASATSNASNAEIANEEAYVDTSDTNLRNAITGLGPNPYFTPPATPPPVDPSATANFSTAAPTSNAFAAAPPANLFSTQRQAMPATRSAS